MTPSGTTVYHYDLAGNLISETDSGGTPIRDYIWHDATPIAQIDSGPTESLVFLHTDHLATLRLTTNTASTAVWRWEGEAFGTTPPNEDVDGDGQATTVNLRFPGQYFDTETDFHYNWNRYYDPSLGRYLTSDPVGLGAGLNTYDYVLNNPVRYFDATGNEPASPSESGAGSSACSYYDGVCGRTGCTYYCRLAPRICRNPNLNLTFWGIPDDKIRCVRKCLIEEDKKAWNNKNNIDPCDGCMDVDVINQYHCSCFSKCGVGAWRYPGVGFAFFPCLRQ